MHHIVYFNSPGIYLLLVDNIKGDSCRRGETVECFKNVLILSFKENYQFCFF